MPTIDVQVSTDVSTSVRARQVSAMFDVPPTEKCELRWKGDLPIDDGDWNVGLIVGPSGSGKSTLAKGVFGEPVDLTWGKASVIDDFSPSLSVEAITFVCQAVGFNTVPAWLRPYAVLSNGEKFRVDLARRLLELPDPIVVDEFTSVVDRQVAQIGAYAVQKYVRRNGRKFVAVSCHDDIVEWLEPDWVLHAATMSFQRRRLQGRPRIECDVGRVHRSVWRLFAPFHYMSADLHPGAACFVLFVRGRPAAFAAVLHRPHPKVRDILGFTRVVTLPDWQGLGLSMALVDTVSAAYRALGKRTHTYPAHPSYTRSFDRSPRWSLVKRPGLVNVMRNHSTLPGAREGVSKAVGARPCAVFEYCGPAMERREAERLVAA
jgi:ABC-type lipoprotein export system ATPase subunit